jgi:hypothetical protein
MRIRFNLLTASGIFQEALGGEIYAWVTCKLLPTIELQLAASVVAGPTGLKKSGAARRDGVKLKNTP